MHSIYSDKLGNRFWFFMYPIPITIVGFVVFMVTHNFGAKYFSLFLMVFIFSMNGTTYAWIANAIPRPPAKRAAAFAFINSIVSSVNDFGEIYWTNSVDRETVPAYGHHSLTSVHVISKLWVSFSSTPVLAMQIYLP